MNSLSMFPKSAYARNILTYLLFNVVTIGAVLGYIYFSTVEVIENEVAEVVETEIRALEEEYIANGIPGLRAALSHRIENADGDAVYLLSAPNNQPIVGNLLQWPNDITTDGEWTIVTLIRRDTSQSISVGARAYSLGLGAKILVGRDMRARRDFQNTLTGAMIGAILLMIILATIGGAVFSRLVLRRLKSIDNTARSIMGGDISKRIPVTKQNDEFDQLSETLNEMLSKVDDLINELRVATESMAHDLRSPLTRLRGHLEQSYLKLDEQSSTAINIEKAIFETDRILKDLNALLNVARLETGIVNSQMEDVRLFDLLNDVSELYIPLVEESEMTISTSISIDQDIKVKMNAQLMAQALSNLIENAIKYAGRGADISISAIRNKDHISIMIADDGPGIPSADRKKALQRFARLSPERKEGGMGLGLYLVSVILKIHKFELSLLDNKPGLKAEIIIPLS